MLRDKSQHFDLVLSDVYMPGEQQQLSFRHCPSHGKPCITLWHDIADVDGFKLLELIGLELDVPVISKCFCLLCHPQYLLSTLAYIKQLFLVQ